MNFFNWLKSWFSHGGLALWLYKRGMARAKRHDHGGAIDDYTATVDMLDAPPDLKAMAQYNRALVHLATKNDPKAIEDLNLILAMKETLINVKTMARQELIRIEGRSTTSRV